MADKITPRSQDYSQWYLDIVQQAKLADYAPVRGAMVIRPYGYAFWEKIRSYLDEKFRQTGHQNCYFPLLIPESFLQQEADHIEGFAPELARVTHGGGKELEEPLVVRPTSETMIWHMYKRWIQSYRDLPLLYNQWANVVRWEMRTRPFLRTTEFLWQEGHTAHATEAEAREEALQMLEIYWTMAEELFAMPVLCGKKTAQEKFAGAVDTFTFEGMMQDGKALQLGTSHYLGQNFAKAFDVTYQDPEGHLSHVHATSWGVTTRLIGALIMTHSDDQGLVLPPQIAPIQVVVVPIWRSEEDQAAIEAFCLPMLEKIRKQFTVEFDDRPEFTPGYKFHEWEMKGVPIRLEIGPRDLEKQQVILARRDTGEKSPFPCEGITETLSTQLTAIQDNLLEQARKRVATQSHYVENYSSFKTKIAEGGFVYAHWSGEAEIEKQIAEETKATIRVIPFDIQEEAGQCILSGKPSPHRVVFARAY